jgi:hypothetical protein
VPGSFVDEALKWRHSDLLFTAPLEGRDALVYWIPPAMRPVSWRALVRGLGGCCSARRLRRSRR